MSGPPLTHRIEIPEVVARQVAARPRRTGVTPGEISKARDLAARCATFTDLRRRPAWCQHEPEQHLHALLEGALDAQGRRRRIPASGLLLFGLLRQAVRCGFPGIRVSYLDLAELLAIDKRTAMRQVGLLERLELLRTVRQYEPVDGRNHRRKNCYVLGRCAPPVRPPRKGKKQRTREDRRRENPAPSTLDRAGQGRSIGALVASFGGAVTTADELVGGHAVTPQGGQSGTPKGGQSAPTTPPTSWGGRARVSAHAREARHPTDSPVSSENREGAASPRITGGGAAGKHAAPSTPAEVDAETRQAGAGGADREGELCTPEDARAALSGLQRLWRGDHGRR